jgi:hypothetical protein
MKSIVRLLCCGPTVLEKLGCAEKNFPSCLESGPRKLRIARHNEKIEIEKLPL